MPLVLDATTQNISTPNGDTGTYTWEDITALGSSKLTTYASGSFQWRGIITISASATLNILEKAIELFGADSASPGIIRASGNGTVNFGETYTVNSNPVYVKGCNITVRRGFGTSGSTTLAALAYDSSNKQLTSAKLNLYASRVYATSSPNNIRIEYYFSKTCECIFSYYNLGHGNFIYLQNGGSFVNSIFDRANIEFVGDYSEFSGCKSYSALDALVLYSGYDSTARRDVVREFSPIGSGRDYYTDPRNAITFINSPAVDLAKGAIEDFQGVVIQAENYKAVEHVYKLVDSNGAVSGAEIRFEGFETLAQTTNASGLAAAFILVIERTNVAGSGSSFAPLPLVNVATYTRSIKSYRHQAELETLAIDSPLGSSAQPFTFGMTIDPGVTQTNTTTVAGYAGITNGASSYTLSGTLTLNQVYDRRKLYWRDNVGVPAPAKIGDRAVFGAAITIAAPANNPAVTAKFKEAETTGSLTLSAAGNYSSTPWIRGSGTTTTVASGTTTLTGWTFGVGSTVNVSSGTASVIVDADQIDNITPGAGVTVKAPPVFFSAANINNNGFDNVRCRTSLYKRSSFATSDVNTSTNRISIAGISGKVTTNTTVRVAGTDLPAPLQPDQIYFPHAIVGSTISLSATAGGAGAEIDLTDTGSGSMVIILITELDIQLVTSGGYSFTLSDAAVAKDVTLSSGDTLLFQAIHWKGSLQSVNPSVASRYHEEFQLYQGASVSTLTALRSYSEHDTFGIQQNTDGYTISQLTVTGSSPTRYQWRIDASSPGKVQIESEDPDRVINTEWAVLYFQFLQWTPSGMRVLRGQIEAENLNSIVIKSPEVGLLADLTVESFPPGTPLLAQGAGMYRSDGQTWIAAGSPIQHQPTALIAVPIEVEKPINLSGDVMQLLHSIAAGVGVITTGGAATGSSPTVEQIRQEMDANSKLATIESQTSKLVFTNSGRVDATAITIANNAITAASIATDAITSSGLAASAVTEIQSGLATQGSVSAIPTNPLLTSDTRLNNLNAPIGSIPTNPLLTNDARLDNLDATVSSRLASTGYTAPDNAGVNSLNTKLTTTRADNLDNLDAAISSRSTASDIPTATQNASAVRTNLATELGRVDTAISTRSSHTAADNWAVATRSLTDKTGFSLSAAGVQAVWEYATRTLTTFGSLAADVWAVTTRTITARPPNTASDTDVTAIKAKTDNLPSSPASTSDVQVTVSGGFLESDRDALEALPTLPEIEASTVLAKSSQIPPAPNNDGIAAIKAKTDVIVVTSGRVAASIDDTLLAKQATVETVATQSARVDALIENSGGDRFTPKALEAAPSGEGGSGLTAEQIWTHEPRTITARPPGTASDTVVAVIKAKTDNLPASPASTADVQVTVDGGFTTDDRTTLEAIPTLVEIEASTTIAMVSDLPPAPDNAGITAIRSKTDSIVISSGRVQAAIDTTLLAKEATIEALPTAAENADAVRTNLGVELGRINATIGSRATPADVQVTVSGGFTGTDRTAITTIAAQVDQLHELEGIENAVTAKDAIAGSPGYRRTETIEQVLTLNPDGSFTMEPAP